VLVSTLLAALFPSACIGCHVPGPALCAACAPDPRSVRRLATSQFDVYAVGRYGGTLRRAVLAYKRGRRDAGDALAALLLERVMPFVPRDAILVPVPTHAARRRERGFDQSVRLARACGGASDLPVVVALRQVAGDGQRGRDRSARLRARGRFACVAPDIIAGASIVLLDDVLTTGATLRDCAATLAACGAQVTAAVVIAYA